ncbi:MAG: tRNA uridine-5-carboxymethylaminomethyl(34) synthesis GTPase MnmE [Tissierellia bacterium]|nr:tRNA uridine-5-carboxymethylaminomethyl(34) synthesis GTPase MnmE [Tissierellia bacterium]
MSETIAAISTAIGESGIGIVRISGNDAFKVGYKIFKGAKVQKEEDIDNRKLTYGHIVDGEKIIDEVLIAFMKGPYTYTREDMVEIYCHGGIISVRNVLNLILRSGAGLAEPGEFTKRAFLNGRLDLAQAEAVIDIINSKTNKSMEVSLNQLGGTLSAKIKEIRDILFDMMAHVEVSIDFSDEDLDVSSIQDLEDKALIVKEKISSLLSTADRGKILRDGLKTVILGKPNVGKSSLLNALLRENRAIVTDIPGTTRDIIEEYINIDGIPLKIIDTAGIRDTSDLVEKIGVDKARLMVEDADLIIAIFDISRKLTEEDMEILDLISDKNTIVLLNKVDLSQAFDEDYFKNHIKNKEIISTSISNGLGIDKIEKTIKEMFYSGEVEVKSDIVVNNIRHKNQLEKAYNDIESFIEDIKNNVPIDCLDVDLKNCWRNLGEISGETISEDILDKIFSEFCIGK